MGKTKLNLVIVGIMLSTSLPETRPPRLAARCAEKLRYSAKLAKIKMRLRRLLKGGRAAEIIGCPLRQAKLFRTPKGESQNHRDAPT